MSFILIAFVLEGSPCLRYLLVASFPQPFPKASFPLVPHLHRLLQNSVFSFLLQLPIPELPFGFRKDLQGLELFSLRVPVSGELTYVLKKQLCLRDAGLSTYPDSTTLDTVLCCFSPIPSGSLRRTTCVTCSKGLGPHEQMHRNLFSLPASIQADIAVKRRVTSRQQTLRVTSLSCGLRGRAADTVIFYS